MSMDDGELIRRIAAKDQEAMKVLVDLYQDRVINTCWKLLGSREDAEDVAQEVFIQVYRSAASFRHESRLTTWLYRIAVNRSLNFLRKHKWSRWLRSLDFAWPTEGNRETEVPAKSSEQPDKALEEKEMRLAVRDALKSLPSRQQAAFVLHKYEGLTYQEIAEVLECSLTSVESLMHRAKLSLQKKLFRYLEKR